ncbi:DUF6176 family protein [Tessaracoccus flavescens]|nr:DUF6176 family protein [Tessaracoccus flavescens]
MSLQLSRARLLDGREASFDECMRMLHDRYDECLATLPQEGMAFEATFLNQEAAAMAAKIHAGPTRWKPSRRRCLERVDVDTAGLPGWSSSRRSAHIIRGSRRRWAI